ncbi:glycosyl transferase [Flavobacteriaceae bacterium (ex Bugula neritina AB1)]|nr:glycosyl transferase [Flavobacteriaceae bacterium (ex Bugula neritina AB1)]
MENIIKVSVITPAYNCADFILETINSVKNQTFSNWEMIIIDDNSTDNTIDIINKAISNDKRIKLLSLKENLGAGVARNKGIEIANGRYIAFLDSDDRWVSEKLEKQIGFMENNDYSFSFTSYKQIEEESKKEIKIIESKKVVTYKKALFNNPIGCLTVIYDTMLLGKIYMPNIKKRQDYALWLKILKKTDGYGLNEVLAMYTIRKNSISYNKYNLIKYQWKVYREIEGFSTIKSFYYLCIIIINKIIKG